MHFYEHITLRDLKRFQHVLVPHPLEDHHLPLSTDQPSIDRTLSTLSLPTTWKSLLKIARHAASSSCAGNHSLNIATFNRIDWSLLWTISINICSTLAQLRRSYVLPPQLLSTPLLCRVHQQAPQPYPPNMNSSPEGHGPWFNNVYVTVYVKNYAILPYTYLAYPNCYTHTHTHSPSLSLSASVHQEPPLTFPFLCAYVWSFQPSPRLTPMPCFMFFSFLLLLLWLFWYCLQFHVHTAYVTFFSFFEYICVSCFVHKELPGISNLDVLNIPTLAPICPAAYLRMTTTQKPTRSAKITKTCTPSSYSVCMLAE